MTYIAYEGEGRDGYRDGYRDQIDTCDVGVSLHSKIHPLFMKYSNGTSTQCHAYQYPSLFPVLLIPICPFLIQIIFAFTCLHSFFTCFHVYYTIVSRQLETELTHDP